jgi:hypothetical protein
MRSWIVLLIAFFKLDQLTVVAWAFLTILQSYSESPTSTIHSDPVRSEIVDVVFVISTNRFNSSVLIHQYNLCLLHSDNEFMKGVTRRSTLSFPKGKHILYIVSIWMHTPHDTTRPVGLDLRNMIKADPDWNMLYSVFVHSLSRPHCLTF